MIITAIDYLEGAPHLKPAVKATPEGLEKELLIKASLLTEGIGFDEWRWRDCVPYTKSNPLAF